MQLLLGGLITLAVTALVQILIIPWVQQRNRRRERWERDVIELETLLENELTKTVSDAFVAAKEFRAAYRVQAAGVSIYDAGPLDGELAELEKAGEVGSLALLALQRRLLLLEKRVRLVNRRAKVWRVLSNQLVGLGMELAEASTAYVAPEVEDAGWSKVWVDLEFLHESAKKTLSFIAVPMKPPPTNRVGAWLFNKRAKQIAAER